MLSDRPSISVLTATLPSTSMAQGSSSLASILLLFFVGSKEYYIVPSQSYPCNVDHCLMLSQFVSDFANCSKYDNTTLIFAPGGYQVAVAYISVVIIFALLW